MGLKECPYFATYQTDDDFQLTPQFKKTICFTPVGCGLNITGTTFTNVTVQGGSDGTVTVGWNGSTGTTYVALNGIYTANTTSESYTFTGLTTGYYDVYIEEGDCADSYSDIHILDGEFRTGTMLVNSPTGLTASENPIIHEIRTAGSGAGQFAQCDFTILDGTISDGDYFKFELDSPFEYTQYFYAKGFPNKSNYFLSSIMTDDNGEEVGTNTRAEIAQSLADAFQQDLLLPKIYRISYDGLYTITLTAKETGERFTLSNDNVTKSGTYLDVTMLSAGQNSYDGQQVDNYSIYVEVFENNNRLQFPNYGNLSDYERIAELELPYQISNSHRFDLSSILKNYVYSTRPEFELTGSTIQPDMMKPYFLRYGEKYPLIKNTNTKKKRFKGSTDVSWFINSALDHNQSNSMTAYGYLGDSYTDINSDFGLSIVKDPNTYNTPPYDLTLTFTDYLLSTGSTTDIKFRYVDTYNSADSGWVTGDSYVIGTGLTSYATGTVYISGNTDGTTVTYSKRWWIILLATNSYGVYGDGFDNSFIVNDVKFLTNSPDPKLIQRDSQEYLYFILQAGYNADIDLRGDLDFYDGTSVTGVTFFNIQTATGNTAGGVMCLNLSYEKLGLEAYETSGSNNRKIKRATFAVYQTDSNNNTYKYTEDRAYRFEIEDRPRKFGITFLNKLGGYDAFDFVGIVEETINRTSGTYTVPIAYNQDGSAGQGFKSTSTYDTKTTNRITCNSGWIDQEHFDWLKELMQSNDIYSYTTENQNYLNLDSFKYQKSSLDDLYEVECTFIQTVYTNSIDI